MKKLLIAILLSILIIILIFLRGYLMTESKSKEFKYTNAAVMQENLNKRFPVGTDADALIEYLKNIGMIMREGGSDGYNYLFSISPIHALYGGNKAEKMFKESLTKNDYEMINRIARIVYFRFDKKELFLKSDWSISITIDKENKIIETHVSLSITKL